MGILENGMWKRTGVILFLILFLLLSFCRGQNEAEGEKRSVVTVSMFNTASFPKWRNYVEQSLPDISIVWVNNPNTMNSLIYQAKHDALPDIFAVRRFESDLALQLAPFLLDLSKSRLACLYDQSVLQPFWNKDRLLWLPAPGQLSLLVANKAVFDSLGMDLPVDWKSFVSACEQLEAKGIRSLVCDFRTGWTETLLVEGVGMDGYLLTEQGMRWKKDFEGGDTDAFDKAFLKAGERLKSLVDKGILRKEDLDIEKDTAYPRMLLQKPGMGRLSTDKKIDEANKGSYAALPLMGDTPEENALYSYPVFMLALSGKLAVNPKKEESARRVLETMLSKEAQQLLNEDGEGLVSYMPGVALPHSEHLRNIKPYLGKRVIVRVLTSTAFQSMQAAVHGLIRGELTPQAFLETLNARPKNEVAEPVPAIPVSQTLSNAVDSNMVSPAASVIAEVIRKSTMTDCASIDVRMVYSSLYTPELSDADVDAILKDEELFIIKATGKELKDLFTQLLYASTCFEYDTIDTVIEAPAFAGMEMNLDRRLLISKIRNRYGLELDPEQTYTLCVSASIRHALVYMNAADPARFVKLGMTTQQAFREQIHRAGELPVPQRYFIPGWTNIEL